MGRATLPACRFPSCPQCPVMCLDALRRPVYAIHVRTVCRVLLHEYNRAQWERMRRQLEEVRNSVLHESLLLLPRRESASSPTRAKWPVPNSDHQFAEPLSAFVLGSARAGDRQTTATPTPRAHHRIYACTVQANTWNHSSVSLLQSGDPDDVTF